MAYFLYVLAWLTPNHYPPWVNFHSEYLAFLALTWVLVRFLKTKQTSFYLNPTVLFFFSLALLPWAQNAVGLVYFVGDAWAAFFYLLGLAFAVCLGVSLPRMLAATAQLPKLEAFAMAVLTAAILSAMVGLLQWLSLTDVLQIAVIHSDPGERVGANLGQPNQLASLLLMGIAALTYLFQRNKIGYLGLVIGVCFLSSVLALTNSRTGVVGAVAMALLFVCKHRYAKEKLRLSVWSAVAWLLMLGAAVKLLPMLNILLLMSDGRDVAFLSNNGRFQIWHQMVYAIAQAPWCGYGWNQTTIAQGIGAVPYPDAPYINYAHNIVLDIIVWVGLPLGVLITILLGYWAFSRVRQASSVESITALLMLMPIAVHSLLEFPFAYAYFLLTAGLLIGWVEGQHSASKIWLVKKPAMGTTVAVLFGLGMYFGYEYLLIEEDYRYARFENLHVGHTPVEYQSPTIWMNTGLAALTASLRQAATPGMTHTQIERLHLVSQRFGSRPLVYRYALALALNGQAVAASQQLTVLRAIFGASYYEAVKRDMQQQAIEKYPQLKAFVFPVIETIKPG